MAFINSYKAPDAGGSTLGSMPYDINFNVPLPLTIETPRVKLAPFIPALHGEAFFAAFHASPDLGRYLPVAFPTYTDLLTFLEFIRSGQNSVVFAILDKAKEKEGRGLKECLAGMIGMLNCSPDNLAVEIGPVIILPAFQRTYVASNAIGAILKHCLNLPSEGGLGFRRVYWTANPRNAASIKAAERMGLKREGLLRWTWCLPLGNVGNEAGKERGEKLGRDSVLLAMCWDDWESGGREHVEKAIERV